MAQKQGLILVGAWMLVFFGFYLFVWRPNLADIKQSRNQLRIAERQLSRLIRDVETWPATVTRARMENYEKRLEHFFSMVPVAEEVPQLLDAIQHQGIERAGLKFVSLDHEIRKEEPSLSQDTSEKEAPTGKNAPLKEKKETYLLTVEGSYADLLVFLRQLETAPRLINVREFTVKRLKEGDGIQAVLTLNIFYTGNAS